MSRQTDRDLPDRRSQQQLLPRPCSPVPCPPAWLQLELQGGRQAGWQGKVRREEQKAAGPGAAPRSGEQALLGGSWKSCCSSIGHVSLHRGGGGCREGHKAPPPHKARPRSSRLGQELRAQASLHPNAAWEAASLCIFPSITWPSFQENLLLPQICAGREMSTLQNTGCTK